MLCVVQQLLQSSYMISNYYNPSNPDFEKFNIPEKLLFYFLRTTFPLVFYFSTTFLYIFYFFISIVGIYGKKSNVCTNVFLCFVLFLCALSIVFSILLKIPRFKQYVEYLIGKQFVDKYSVKGFNGFLAPLMFILAVFLPITLEYYSFHQRLDLYQRVMDPLFEAYIIESNHYKTYTPQMGIIDEMMKSFVKPSHGIITEIVRKIGL